MRHDLQLEQNRSQMQVDNNSKQKLHISDFYEQASIKKAFIFEDVYVHIHLLSHLLFQIIIVVPNCRKS